MARSHQQVMLFQRRLKNRFNNHLTYIYILYMMIHLCITPIYYLYIRLFFLHFFISKRTKNYKTKLDLEWNKLEKYFDRKTKRKESLNISHHIRIILVQIEIVWSKSFFFHKKIISIVRFSHQYLVKNIKNAKELNYVHDFFPRAYVMDDCCAYLIHEKMSKQFSKFALEHRFFCFWTCGVTKNFPNSHEFDHYKSASGNSNAFQGFKCIIDWVVFGFRSKNQ